MLKKQAWPLTAALLAISLLGVLVLFGIIGRTTQELSRDGRIQIVLSSTERDLVLAEMRQLLAASQAVLIAALDEDMTRVAETARQVGMADVRAMPIEIRAPLLGKLPIGFKQMGFSVHEGMDAIARDAEALGDRDHALRQLGNLMGQCVACHAAYTILPPMPDGG